MAGVGVLDRSPMHARWSGKLEELGQQGVRHVEYGVSFYYVFFVFVLNDFVLAELCRD